MRVFVLVEQGPAKMGKAKRSPSYAKLKGTQRVTSFKDLAGSRGRISRAISFRNARDAANYRKKAQVGSAYTYHKPRNMPVKTYWKGLAKSALKGSRGYRKMSNREGFKLP